MDLTCTAPETQPTHEEIREAQVQRLVDLIEIARDASRKAQDLGGNRGDAFRETLRHVFTVETMVVASQMNAAVRQQQSRPPRPPTLVLPGA